LKAQTPINIQ